MGHLSKYFKSSKQALSQSPNMRSGKGANDVTVIALDNEKFDRLPYKYARKAKGMAIPREKVAYIRMGPDQGENRAALEHEMQELSAKESAHEIDGVRYGFFSDIGDWFQDSVIDPVKDFIDPVLPESVKASPIQSIASLGLAPFTGGASLAGLIPQTVQSTLGQFGVDIPQNLTNMASSMLLAPGVSSAAGNLFSGVGNLFSGGAVPGAVSQTAASMGYPGATSFANMGGIPGMVNTATQGLGGIGSGIMNLFGGGGGAQQQQPGVTNAIRPQATGQQGQDQIVGYRYDSTTGQQVPIYASQTIQGAGGATQPQQQNILDQIWGSLSKIPETGIMNYLERTFLPESVKNLIPGAGGTTGGGGGGVGGLMDIFGGGGQGGLLEKVFGQGGGGILDPYTLAGLGISSIPMFQDDETPQIPESPYSQAAAGKIGVQDTLARGELEKGIMEQFQPSAPFTPTSLTEAPKEYYEAETRRIDENYDKAEEAFRTKYKGLRPGANVEGDSAFREGITDLQRDRAREKSAIQTQLSYAREQEHIKREFAEEEAAKGRTSQEQQAFYSRKYNNIVASLNLDDATTKNYMALAQLDADRIATNVGITVGEAARFKEIFADIGGYFIQKGLGLDLGTALRNLGIQ